VGVVWGTLTLLFALYLVFMPPEDPEQVAAFVGPEAMMSSGGPEPSWFDAEPPSEEASDGEEALRMLPAQVTAARARSTLITSAALPLASYVFFLVFYLTIDVMRAILAIPGEIGKLGRNDD
jgi:hypothetical protein